VWHTCPLAVSDSWRVHKFERFNEPSFRDNAMPIVAAECDDRLLEYEAQETLKGSLKQAKELVQFDLQNTNYPPSCLHPN